MENKETCVAGSGCIVCGTVKPLMRRMWSDATNDHFRNARVEFWKGVRSLVDDRISRLAKDEPKGTRVVVE